MSVKHFGFKILGPTLCGTSSESKLFATVINNFQHFILEINKQCNTMRQDSYHLYSNSKSNQEPSLLTLYCIKPTKCHCQGHNKKHFWIQKDFDNSNTHAKLETQHFICIMLLENIANSLDPAEIMRNSAPQQDSIYFQLRLFMISNLALV